MSFQSDLITALAGVASNKIYPQAAPDRTTVPLVIFRILNKDTLQTLNGTTGQTNYSVVFECYASTYSGALTLAGSITTALEISSLVVYRESAPGEEYEYTTDAFMEPVYFGFWH